MSDPITFLLIAAGVALYVLERRKKTARPFSGKRDTLFALAPPEKEEEQKNTAAASGQGDYNYDAFRDLLKKSWGLPREEGKETEPAPSPKPVSKPSAAIKNEPRQQTRPETKSAPVPVQKPAPPPARPAFGMRSTLHIQKPAEKAAGVEMTAPTLQIRDIEDTGKIILDGAEARKAIVYAAILAQPRAFKPWRPGRKGR